MHECVCEKCKREFQSQRIVRYCSKACRTGATHNARRADKRANHQLVFVGVDGEGVDRPDGKHEYVMLSVGEKTLTNNGYALTLQQIFTFLWECYTTNPEACYVGFFLGYDFIQWEKLLPHDTARLLLTSKGISERTSQRKSRLRPHPDPVVWEGWEIDVMAGRRFKLKPHTHRRGQYNGRCTNRTCRVDLGELNDGPDIYDPRGEQAFSPDLCVLETDYRGNPATYWKRVRRVLLEKWDSAEGNPQPQSGKRIGTLYICDTGPFWQTSFLNVINPSSWEGVEPVCTPEEFAIIEKGKADRGTTADYGDTSYLAEMAQYNVLENEILSRVTSRLNEGFSQSDIPIKIPRTDWYGPGRAAQIWMDMLHARIADREAVEANKHLDNTGGIRRNEKGLLNADVYMSMPSSFVDAARASYYGGWFEQFMHGHIGDVWEYDINSAYPFIIASLPCLHTEHPHTGRYSRGVGNPPHLTENAFLLVFGTFRGSDPYIGGLPYRTKQGAILRPHVTRGWYWWHEVEAALRAGLLDSYTIEEWESYISCHCDSPFNPSDIGIQRLYEMRLRVGKNTPQGKSAKLVYNSAYGKTAQSIGSPKYANPVYASLITAGCRTLILDAISTHPERSSAVSMVATDGIYFTSAHPTLALDKERLGAWDFSIKRNMTQLMPGVYWDDATREQIAEGTSPKLKSRGINARDLANEIDNLDRLFAEAHYALGNGENYSWPELEIRVRFLLTSAKSALHRGKWDTAGTVEHDTIRRISSNPGSKRNPEAYRDSRNGLTRTRPYDRGTTIDTTPYAKSFGYLQEIVSLFGDDVTPDGDPMIFWRDALS